jgi:hypothetical protein
VSNAERGEGLVETILAVAITSVVLLVVLGAVISAAHRLGPDPVRDALARHAQSELRLAINALKYQGASLTPSTVATSVPLASGSSISAHETLGTTTNADGSIAISVSATADGQTGESASAAATVTQPAPAPSTSIPAQSTGGSPI